MKNMEFYVIKTNKGYLNRKIGSCIHGFATTDSIYGCIKDDNGEQLEKLCKDVEKELEPSVIKIKCMEC